MLLAVVVIGLSSFGAWLHLPSGMSVGLALIWIALLAASEFSIEWHPRLALRWLVPTHLVEGDRASAAEVWGRALGAGFLTDAPRAVYHAAMGVPIVLGSWPFALASTTIFAASRATPYLTDRALRVTRLWADRSVQGRSALFVGSRRVSALVLVASLVSSLAAVSV